MKVVSKLDLSGIKYCTNAALPVLFTPRCCHAVNSRWFVALQISVRLYRTKLEVLDSCRKHRHNDNSLQYHQPSPKNFLSFTNYQLTLDLYIDTFNCQIFTYKRDANLIILCDVKWVKLSFHQGNSGHLWHIWPIFKKKKNQFLKGLLYSIRVFALFLSDIKSAIQKLKGLRWNTY